MDAVESTVESEGNRHRNEDRGRSYYGPSHGARCRTSCSCDRSPPTTRNGHVIFVSQAKVFAMGGPNKSVPVAIGHKIPFVKLLFGPGEEGRSQAQSLASWLILALTLLL